MFQIYGCDKSDEEIIEMVSEYVRGVKNSATDRYHHILDLVPEKNGSALDYGCGWGHYTLALRDKGYDVTAIDLSPNQIGICKLVWKGQERVDFAEKSILDLPNKRFDLVLSNQVLEHVHNVGSYLNEISRVLKDGGVLILSLPNVMTPRFILSLLHSDLDRRLVAHSEWMLANYSKGEHHINAWDPYHLTTLLASLGFALDRYIPTEGVALPFTKFTPSYWATNVKALSNLSYTMTFRFIKKRQSACGPHD